MHSLWTLPCELRDIIFTDLPQSTLAQLCLVNQLSYGLSLPYLYRHVHIKIRKQLAQLDKGIQRSSVLREVVRVHTKRLTLTSCQSSFQWLISHTQAEWCQRWMPHLAALTFCDFAILPMERVGPFLALSTSLETVRFRYCNLICHDQPEAYIPMLPEDHIHTSIYQLPATYSYHTKENKDDEDDEEKKTHIQPPSSLPRQLPSTSTKRLILDWTDFSPTAMDVLLSTVPSLTHVSLGANHNRLKNANTTALTALERHCPRITSLTLALQQLEAADLARLITHYNVRLLHLDLQYLHVGTLAAVAQHATNIEQLTLRAVKGNAMHQHIPNGRPNLPDSLILTGDQLAQLRTLVV
jgi:hypothetical protein